MLSSGLSWMYAAAGFFLAAKMGLAFASKLLQEMLPGTRSCMGLPEAPVNLQALRGLTTVSICVPQSLALPSRGELGSRLTDMHCQAETWQLKQWASWKMSGKAMIPLQLSLPPRLHEPPVMLAAHAPVFKTRPAAVCWLCHMGSCTGLCTLNCTVSQAVWKRMRSSAACDFAGLDHAGGSCRAAYHVAC